MSNESSTEKRIAEIIKKDTVIWERPETLDEGLNPMALLQLTMLDDIQVALTKLSNHFKKQEFLGRVDPRTLAATDEIQQLALLLDWPFMPWITASAHNYGPNTVYISINRNYEWIPLRIHEEHKFEFSSAEERIYIIHYRCNPGENATVQINGKY